MALKEIKQKLNSVQNIQKITKAMEMVAGARLKKAHVKSEKAHSYIVHLEEILESILAEKGNFDHPFFNKKAVKKTAFVVIGSDKGLCGSYNQNIFSAVEKLLQKHQKEDVELILIGKKAVDYFSLKPWKIGHTLPSWSGKITHEEIKALTLYLTKQFLDATLDEIFLAYTHYINIMTRDVVVQKLFPMEQDPTILTKKTCEAFEPEVDSLLNELLPHYFTIKMQSVLNEALVSELAARVFSMRAATKNADEMMEKLTLVRNQIRQSTITRELIEITSCTESLK